MKRNMSGADRGIRAILGVALVAGGLLIGEPWGVVLYILAAIMFLTALFAICPLYRLFGIDTCKMSKTCPD